MTIERALRDAAASLKETSDSPHLDAGVLLGFVLKRDKTFLFSHPHDHMTLPTSKRFATLFRKRKNGVPVAYLTREKWFYGRAFFVDKRVLIPRPLTESLVDRTLAFIRRSRKRPIVVADIGTGSGCIAVSIAAELRDHSPTRLKRVRIFATDISEPALTIAKKNARRHKVERFITFLNGDLLNPLRGKRLDLIVANLPYVPTERAKRLPDPRIALDGGATGGYVYARLKRQLSRGRFGRPRVLLERER